jgi:DNA-binding winged helix-turn-helix (wHTH) protein
MITKDNPTLNSTAESIYMSNADENIRELCRRRQDAIAHEEFQKKLIQQQADEIASLSDEIARMRKLLEDNGIKF